MLEAFELTVHFTVLKSCSLRNITWRCQKRCQREKRNFQIVWTTLLYQVDRCFPWQLMSKKLRSGTVMYKQSYAESSVSVRTRSHEKVRLQAFYTQLSGAWTGAWTAVADWSRVRSAPRAVSWAVTSLPGTAAEIENNAGGEGAKLKGGCAPIFVSTDKTQKLAAIVT